MPSEHFVQFDNAHELSRSARKWNGNDESQRNHHGLIPIDEDPFDIILKWKASRDAVSCLVGYYRLNLRMLQAAGYLPPTRDGKVRLRFFRDADGSIYIEPMNRAVRLKIGAVAE